MRRVPLSSTIFYYCHFAAYMAKRTYITKEDIERLFYTRQKKWRLLSWPIISSAILIVVAIFYLINAPAFNQQLSYWFKTDILANIGTEDLPSVPNIDLTITPPADQPTKPPAGNPAAAIPAIATLPNNYLYVPRVGIRAPVIWNVEPFGDINTNLLKTLQNGVTRYPETALPDQLGNVFLTGHSSNYWWDKGKYKTVFALLDKLVAGDMVYLKYDGVLYSYRVTEQSVIKPTETSALVSNGEPILSLMTCTPTGTTLYRRIVRAKLISPTTGLKPLTAVSQYSGSSLAGVR